MTPRATWDARTLASPRPPTTAQKAAARRVAAVATDREDLRTLLDMLGLLPEQPVKKCKPDDEGDDSVARLQRYLASLDDCVPEDFEEPALPPFPERQRAACRDEDPELFFPVGTSGPALEQAVEAKAVCGRCPVAAACLAWALATGQDDGIWGGTTAEERRAPHASVPRGPHRTQPGWGCCGGCGHQMAPRSALAKRPELADTHIAHVGHGLCAACAWQNRGEARCG